MLKYISATVWCAAVNNIVFSMRVTCFSSPNEFMPLTTLRRDLNSPSDKRIGNLVKRKTKNPVKSFQLTPGE